MAYPSVTYTFTNATTSDATQVNTNFNNIISGFSDGTKDYSMNNGTLAGTLSVTGKVTFDAAIKIKEGIAAPSNVAGYVQLYVDTTTKQLRVIDSSGNIYEVALNPIP